MFPIFRNQIDCLQKLSSMHLVRGDERFSIVRTCMLVGS